MKKTLFSAAVALMLLAPAKIEAVPFMINPYTPDWVNAPIYAIDCYFGGYVWGKC
jgi:hypothetical protein